jgi:hypothetical protein
MMAGNRFTDVAIYTNDKTIVDDFFKFKNTYKTRCKNEHSCYDMTTKEQSRGFLIYNMCFCLTIRFNVKYDNEKYDYYVVFDGDSRKN